MSSVLAPASPKQAAFMAALADEENDIVLFGGELCASS